jgi:transcription factor MBP1
MSQRLTHFGIIIGTWVPFERGKALAEQYEVDRDLAPILEFVKGDESPPLAPKHVTAASTRPKKARETQGRARKRVKHYDEDLSDIEAASQSSSLIPQLSETDASFSSNGATPSSSRRDNSPSSPGKRSRAIKKEKGAPSTPKTQLRHQFVAHDADDDMTDADNQQDDEEDDELSDEQEQRSVADYHNETTNSSEKQLYAQKLLSYFMSTKSGVSSLLQHPPRDLDVNIIIDDEGHTSLHWASAMARIKVVKLLLDNGADMYRVNYKGQTALMRSVLFTNNFDSKTFDSLLTLLRTTIFNIDKKDQTVFHHIATTAAWRGKIHASRYYMECLISKLNTNRSELISILNVQDAYGDTALTIAARSGNKRSVKLLIDAGASTEIANEKGMTARDYFNEFEKVASDNLLSPPTNGSSHSSDDDDDGSIMDDLNTRQILREKIESMLTQLTVNTGSVPPISEVFDNFAESYEKDLITKDKTLQKKKNELDLLMKRLEETKRVVESIQLGNDDDEQIIAVIRQAEDQSVAMEVKLKKWLQYSQKQALQALDEFYLNNNAEEKPPSPPHLHTVQELRESANKLQRGLKDLQQARKDHVNQLVQLRCQIPSKKYQNYKRLISTSCNVAYENVDLMLSPLLQSFDEAAEEQRKEMVMG